MYGLVNQAIADLVISNHGDYVWRQVKAAAGVDLMSFEAEEIYDDALTFDLISAISETLDTEGEEIVEALGRHWLTFTGDKGWGGLLDAAGSSMLQVLEALDGLHARIATTMPGARMPVIRVLSSDDTSIEIDYFSERQGLAPMMKGLITALGERLNDPYDIVETAAVSDDDGARHQFRLTRKVAVGDPA